MTAYSELVKKFREKNSKPKTGWRYESWENPKVERLASSNPLGFPEHMIHQYEGGQLTPEEFYQHQSIPQSERPLTGAEGGRVQYKPGGLVEPGVTHYATRTRPDALMTQDYIDALNLKDNIKNTKFRPSTYEDIANKFKFVGKAGKTNKPRAERALANAQKFFPEEMRGFQLSSIKYPKIDKKLFKNANMVADAITDYLKSAAVGDEEAKLLLTKNNMASYHARKVPIVQKGTETLTEFYKWGINSQERKYVIDRVNQNLAGTELKFNNKAYDKVIEESRAIRKIEGSKASMMKIHAEMNNEILKLHGDDAIQKLLAGNLDNAAKEKLLARTMKVLDTEDAANAMRRLFMLGEAYSDGKMTRTLPGIDVNEKLSQKIITTQGAQKHRYALQGILYKHYANRIDSALGNTPGKRFIGYYQKRIRDMLAKGISPDEIFSVTASARRGLEPYAIFTQGLREDVNSIIKGSNIDSALSRTHADLQDIFQGKKWAQLSKADQKAAEKLVVTYEQGVRDTLRQAPANVRNKIQVANFDLKNPPEKSIENFNTRFGKGEGAETLKKAFKTSYNKIGYSMKVPKNFATQKQFLKTISKSGLSKGKITFGVLTALGLGTGAAMSAEPDDEVTKASMVPEFLTEHPVLSTAGAGTAYALSKPTGRQMAKSLLKGLFETKSKWSGFWGIEPPLMMAGEVAAHEGSIKNLEEQLKNVGIFGTKVNPENMKQIMSYYRRKRLEKQYGRDPEKGVDFSMTKDAPYEFQKDWEKGVEEWGMELNKDPDSFYKMLQGMAVDQESAKAAMTPYIESEQARKIPERSRGALDFMTRYASPFVRPFGNLKVREYPAYDYNTGGRVGFKAGGIDKGRRAFMKWLAGITGAGVAAGTGLLKWGKIGGKGTTAIKAGDKIIQGTPGMPDWYIPLINRIVNEGTDVTKKLGTVEREIVHTKKIGKGEEVTVYQNLDTGNVRVDYDSPYNMGEGMAPVSLEYRAPQVIAEGKHAGKKTKSEFDAAEPEPVGYTHGPDDYSVEWDSLNIVGRAEDLVSDTSKLKQFATKKKPTMGEIVTRKRKIDEVDAIHKNETDYISTKQGEGEWDDYLPDIDDID